MGLKVVFFCGHLSAYGKAHLEPILKSGFEVVAVVLADRKRWSHFRAALTGQQYSLQNTWPEILNQNKRNLLKSTVQRLKSELLIGQIRNVCARKNIPLWCINDANNPDFIQRIESLNCDLILAAAYPQIFSEELIRSPSLGSINFHASLLPRFRGAHPHFWAIASGEKESGLTAHFMTAKIDDGDVVAQLSYPIADLNYNELYEKMIDKTPEIVRSVAAFFSTENRRAAVQDDAKATYFRNDREIHHKIFWETQSASQISDLVRTGTAYCFFRNERVGIIDVFVTTSNRNLTNNIVVPSGVIVDLADETLSVKAIDGCVNIRKFSVNNKVYSAKKWTSKRRAEIGERFF